MSYNKKIAHEHSQNVRPQTHYYENEELFVLFFKSREKWSYYTIIFKQDILELDPKSDDAIEKFKINNCSNSLQVIEITGLDLPQRIKIESLEMIEEEKEQIDNSIEEFEEMEEQNLELDEEQIEDLQQEIEVNDSEIIIKNAEIIDYKEIVKEAQSYSDFLEILFKGFERKVLSSLEKVELKKDYKIFKTFPEFLRNLFAAVNTVTFAKFIKKFITQDFKVGKEAAEEELGVNLSYNENMKKQVNQLYEQQINGYNINGEHWSGIKGVTKEIQFETIKIVQEGITQNKSLKEVKEEIENVFDKFKGSRANAIARTETNRIINRGLMVTYDNISKEFKMEVRKSIDSNTDNGTSPICLRMVAKYGKTSIPLYENFVDDEGEGATMQSFPHPPFNIHCRRRLVSRTKLKKS